MYKSVFLPGGLSINEIQLSVVLHYANNVFISVASKIAM